MSDFSRHIDHEVIDFHMRRAHAACADAFSAAFASAGLQIKTLFSSPDVEPDCETC